VISRSGLESNGAEGGGYLRAAPPYFGLWNLNYTEGVKFHWRSRPVLAGLALVFAAATLLYNIVWMVDVRLAPPQPAVELGYDDNYLADQHALLITSVYKGSPAEKAGMLPGDRILAVNGEAIADADFTRRVWMRHSPGDSIQLTLGRPGEPAPVVSTGVFRRRVATPSSEGPAGYFATQVRNSFPVPFVVVGLAVLFLRLEDPKVWLLALLFAALAATPGFPDTIRNRAPALQAFLRAYQPVFLGMLGALFYCFFAVFPTRSPIDRRHPWLKWVSVAAGLAVALPGLRTGSISLPPPLPRLLGQGLSQKITIWSLLCFVMLGFVSLAINFHRTQDPEARRKIRVIFWGTAIGLAPNLADVAARDFAGIQSPAWRATLLNLVEFLMPLSFAYAVVKHRVLEIPVLLRRSARYLLVQRGFTFLLSLASIGLTLAFALSFPRYLKSVIEVAQSSSIALGAVFGTVLLWGGTQVHKQVSGRIDRAFFRRAYDARVILEDLAEKTRAAMDRGSLARLLQRHLTEALAPKSLVIYLQEASGRLTAVAGAVPPELESIPADLPLLAKLAAAGQPCDYPPGESALAALDPECLVPMLERGGRMAGLLVLGARLSEEPYSGEDWRLLASVASQAGTALENIRMAEEIAGRIETERRASREMEIAKEVQNRLLPQTPPHLRTLECAARCIQARAVGGDYYDFLDLGADRLGLVLADVSGKGVHAALLMANLQAHLRGQSAISPADPIRLLREVNRLLWKSTSAQHYATLFFGIYDDAARRLLYVNCGHNPPMLLRRDGALDRLPATATVIGAFEKWEGSVGEVQLAAGDLLVVFSDGVSEAARGEEEFGEGRLIDELRAHRHLPVDEMITAIFTSVERFSAGAQSDDLTLLAGRVTGGA